MSLYENGLSFENLSTEKLIQILRVSETETEKALAEKVLYQKWKGKMYEACKSGKVEIVKILLKKSSSEEGPKTQALSHGRQLTPFMVACIYGHKDVVKVLLDHCKRVKNLK